MGMYISRLAINTLRSPRDIFKVSELEMAVANKVYGPPNVTQPRSNPVQKVRWSIVC